MAREIEIKLLLESHLSLEQVSRTIMNYLVAKHGLEFTLTKPNTVDVYWINTGGGPAEWVRLRRDLGFREGVLTTKFTDKGSNINRGELESTVWASTAYDVLKSLFGKEAGILYKNSIMYVNSTLETSVSVYQVDGSVRVYLEIEGPSLRAVNKLAKDFLDYADYTGVQIIGSSLYEMFVLGQEAKLEPYNTPRRNR